jgi:hypothetical protein
MLNSEFGCTVAKPPETITTLVVWEIDGEIETLTEERFASAALLDDFDETGF